MKYIPILISILLLSTSIPSFGAAENGIKTIYVDDDNISGPWDGSIEHPFQDIQEGINVSVSGDSIYVFNGTYREILSIPRSITLEGENPQLTIIDAMDEGNAITVLSDNVNIHDFTITNTTYPPYTKYHGIYLSHVNHCTISDNIVFSTESIYLYDSSDSTITNNTIYRNGHGILLSESSNNTITYNSMFGNGCGVTLWASSNTMVTNNNIKDNGCGIFLRELSYNNMIISNTICNNGEAIELSAPGNTIAANTIGNNSIGGIRLFTSNTNISDNVFHSNGITIWGSTEEEWTTQIIENNVLNGKPILYYKFREDVKIPSDTAQVIVAHCTNVEIMNLSLSNVEAGIQVGFSDNVIITGNVITDNVVGAVMLTYSSDSIIDDNIINNNFLGIYLSYSSDNIIADNTITNSYYSGEGIYLYYSSDTSITGNIIENNYYGLSLAYSSKNMITNNIITDNNATGISLMQDCSDNIIRGNIINGNKEYGIHVYDADSNNITANNFIRNTIQAYFIASRYNIWSGNYWDDWISSFPRLIWGEKLIPFRPFSVPWFTFDWHPANQPFDIPISEVNFR